MTTEAANPLSGSQALESLFDLLPMLADILPNEGNFLNDIQITEVGQSEEGNRVRTEYLLTIINVVKLDIPVLYGFELVLGYNEQVGDESRITIICYNELGTDRFLTAQISGEIALQFPRELLRPAKKSDTGWQEDGAASHQYAVLKNATVHIDADLNLYVNDLVEVKVGAAFLGQTDFVVEMNKLHVGMVKGNFEVGIDSASLTLPDMSLLPPNTKLTLKSARINGQGLSGTVALELAISYSEQACEFIYSNTDTPARLFGLKGGLRHFAMTFEQNRMTGSDVTGVLLIPYFNEPVEIRLNFTDTGDFTITIQAVEGDGITLTKEELLALTIQSLTVSKQSDRASIIVSGGLEPLLMTSDGLKWPCLDVKDLSIEQDINDLTKLPILSFKEAWVDLKDLATLDLWGFHFELNRLGLGYEEGRDRLWLDLTGSLRLMEQIPVGLGVEGFRLSWPRTIYELLNIQSTPTLNDITRLASQLEVKFDGVHFFYGIPQTVEFEGYIRFIKEAQKVGFAGDVVLRVPTPGFSLEAGLMVGMNFAQPQPYPFLYVYLGVELPSGIPLGQSGLALKGALGLFGLNVVPDKTPDQNWYYDWYKRGPLVGAHQTNKWRDELMALALGIGVTITTADGYIKGVRGLLVLALPGPMLMLEGRSLIFDGLLSGEPPLRAMAVFDGRERIVQFNVEAEATIVEDMFDAYGMLEAFFDFKDLTNWHLYLGQNEPRDRRIQANIFKFRDAFLFKADAYLMVDMIGSRTLRSRMGASIGFKPDIPPMGPVQVTIDAVIEGDSTVTVLPEQFSGELDLSATMRFQAFGFGVQLVAGAGMLTEGPRPLKVDVEMHIRVELPLPLPLQAVQFLLDSDEDSPSLDFEASFEFSWQSPEPPEIVPPLLSITADSPFAPGGGALIIHEKSAVQNTWQHLAERSPLVPIDTRPVLAFTHEMNDKANESGPAFARHPDGKSPSFDVGLMRFTPDVTGIRLYRHRKGNPWPNDLSDWELIATSRVEGNNRLPGVWMTEADPHGPDHPTTRRLQLWTSNPLLHANRAIGPAYSMHSFTTKRLDAPSIPRASFAEELLNLYPDLHKCTFQDTQRVCVLFNQSVPIPDKPGQPWSYQGIRFTHYKDGRASFDKCENEMPHIDASELKILRDDLLKIDPTIAPSRPNLSLASLQQWSTSITPELQLTIRRQLPNWMVVWDWLWQHRTCLHLSGTSHSIQFPEPVRKVWITFCSSSKQRFKLQTLQMVQSVSALIRIRDKYAGLNQDLRMCTEEVDHQCEVIRDQWFISADKAFQCLQISGLGDCAIAEICYQTEAEEERANRATAQCAVNRDVGVNENKILQPGSYYRLEVETSITGEVLIPPLTVNLDERLIDWLQTLYEDILTQLGFNGTKTYSHTAFFQTEGPPTQLTRYIKWSNPEPQALRVFRADDFSLRFLRSNIKDMFRQPSHELKLLVRSAEGRLIDGYQTTWRRAKSASLLHEEQLWRQHTETSDPPLGDDLLIAQRSNVLLEPQARYELLLTGGDGGELLFHEDFMATLSPQVWSGTLSNWHVNTENGRIQHMSSSAGVLFAGDPGWTDIDIQTEVLLPSDAHSAGLLFRTQKHSSIDNEQQAHTGCQLRLQRRSGEVTQVELHLESLKQEPSVPVRELASASWVGPVEMWIQLRVQIIANHLRVWVFDELMLDGNLYIVNTSDNTIQQPVGTMLWFTDPLDTAHQQALEDRRLMPSMQGSIGLSADRSGPYFRRLQVRNAVLHTVPFTTSAFVDFGDLVASATPPIDVPNVMVNSTLLTQATNTAMQLATARRRWERGQVDFRFEWINREELEELRLILRQARADHDNAFRALAETVSSELYYQAQDAGIEVYRLMNTKQQVIGIWLRSPESLDLRQEWDDSDGSGKVHIGRTTWAIQQQSERRTLPVLADWRAYHNADSTQVIFLLSKGSLKSGNYQIRFVYHRDHDDENKPDPKHGHRYDRPIEQSGASSGGEPTNKVVALLSF